MFPFKTYDLDLFELNALRVIMYDEDKSKLANKLN